MAARSIRPGQKRASGYSQWPGVICVNASADGRANYQIAQFLSIISHITLDSETAVHVGSVFMLASPVRCAEKAYE